MKSPLILAAVVALVGGFLFGGAVGAIQQMRIESIRADHLATLQQYAQAAADAEYQARQEEQRRIEAIYEVQTNARQEIEQANADAAAARTTANRLRAEVARVSQSARDTAVASGSTSTGDPIGVLGRLFAEADEFAGIVAEHSRKARIAGLACEKSYDALRGKTTRSWRSRNVDQNVDQTAQNRP